MRTGNRRGCDGISIHIANDSDDASSLYRLCRVISFQSTSPMMAMTRHSIQFCALWMHFNPHTNNGDDANAGAASVDPTDFNPHANDGDDNGKVTFAVFGNISIHIANDGDDARSFLLAGRLSDFNPHANDSNSPQKSLAIFVQTEQTST